MFAGCPSPWLPISKTVIVSKSQTAQTLVVQSKQKPVLVVRTEAWKGRGWNRMFPEKAKRKNINMHIIFYFTLSYG